MTDFLIAMFNAIYEQLARPDAVTDTRQQDSFSGAGPAVARLSQDLPGLHDVAMGWAGRDPFDNELAEAIVLLRSLSASKLSLMSGCHIFLSEHAGWVSY